MFKSFAYAAFLPAMVFGVQNASAGGYGSLNDGPAIQEGYNWTGFYAGAHVGGAWGDASVKDTDGGVNPGPFKYSPSGAFGGGTAGYNWQRDRFVFGIEGDLGYLGLDGSKRISSSDGTGTGGVSVVYHQDATTDGGLYGDITGRLGFLATPATLIYAKGGFAFFDGEAEQASTKPWYKPTGTDTFTGWTVGGGIEHYLSQSISIKVEYQYFDFGTEGGFQEKVSSSLDADDGTPLGAKYHNKTTLDANSVKFGIAYHF